MTDAGEDPARHAMSMSTTCTRSTAPLASGCSSMVSLYTRIKMRSGLTRDSGKLEFVH
jgi:hypothetical protein